jgi:phosphate-selective porin OprO and OprP
MHKVSILTALLRLFVVIAVLTESWSLHAQNTGGGQPQPAPAAQTPTQRPNLENKIEAGESEEAFFPKTVPRGFKSWNEYRGPYFTIRVGGGFLFDTAWFSQDDQSKEQIKLSPGYKVRDARLLIKGSFPKFKRSVTYSSGIMYDGPTHSFLVRETGVMIAVPELWGNLFVGRTKEGFSLNKVMVGYAGWTMERTPLNDASIPILADGIKWLGYSPKYGFAWNLGAYWDWLSHNQSFSTYSKQQVARLIWLPVHSEEQDKLFHLGLNLRYGTPKDDMLQLRSRPEAFPAPYFVDTGKFPATSTFMPGYEAYYRQGPLLFGSEYWFVNTHSPSTHNPVFNGGNIVVSWFLTGETREYNTVGGFFKQVSPRKSVFSGGKGAWELVGNFSTIDLDEGTLRGGQFKRITPMLNWYLSDNIRLETNYGYGHLNRFNLSGNTQFFQTRIQLQF